VIVAALMFSVAVPPFVSVTVWVELLPTFTPLNATGEGLIVKPAALAAVIERASAAVPVPPLLLALSVTEKLPAAVGVPEINPLLLLTLNPPGSPLAP
jgi:hypothetical protein